MVNTSASPDILQRILKRIEGEFVSLGAREPYWSVLAEDRFKSNNISHSENEFFESGRGLISEMRYAAERCHLDLSRYQSCFELGCGVGRTTVWLARQFSQVVGGDISSIHLDYARMAAAQFRLHNVNFISLKDLRSFQILPPFDVFFTFMVLQYNPPPLMAFILEIILNQLAPGGIAYFQIPTYSANYSFSLCDYFAAMPPKDELESHSLPQASLFEIIYRTGCVPLESREDGAMGTLVVSNRMLIQKLENKNQLHQCRRSTD
jgi:SAM-dependent methyltransferase